MITINMLSEADSVKGQGVLSAHDEQVNLIKKEGKNEFIVYENKFSLCDIEHYHTINPKFYLRLPFVKLKSVTVGYVHFLPETLEKSIKIPTIFKKVFYKYVINFYKSMDYLVTVNPYFIDRLEYYGIDKNKITYIPNFVSDKQFFKIDDKLSLRRKYNLEKNDFVVLCVGQLQRRKGIFDFIEVAKNMPDIKFLWAGSFAFGKISDGYDDIKMILNNPPDNVKFLGLIERDEMNNIYNLSDVLFLPSYEELFPMTVLESMNCGVPILLRDIDLYKNILFDYYLKGNNVSEFISIIQRLKYDTNFRKKAQNNSLEGHLFYSKEHVGSMWKEFYHNIVLNKQQSFINSLIFNKH